MTIVKVLALVKKEISKRPRVIHNEYGKGHPVFKHVKWNYNCNIKTKCGFGVDVEKLTNNCLLYVHVLLPHLSCFNDSITINIKNQDNKISVDNHVFSDCYSAAKHIVILLQIFACYGSNAVKGLEAKP
jgi:hypothetical protein